LATNASVFAICSDLGTVVRGPEALKPFVALGMKWPEALKPFVAFGMRTPEALKPLVALWKTSASCPSKVFASLASVTALPALPRKEVDSVAHAAVAPSNMATPPDKTARILGAKNRALGG